MRNLPLKSNWSRIFDIPAPAALTLRRIELTPRSRLVSRWRNQFNLALSDILGKARGSRNEDFQSSCRSGTMCHHRSLLVSIQAFNGGLSRSILPIRTNRNTWFIQSTFKAVGCSEARFLFLRQWRVYVLPRFRHKTSAVAEDSKA